jgi:hypothetical protein
MPRAFPHTVPVPGLAHLAMPPFPDVGCFDSLKQVARQVKDKVLDPSAKTDDASASLASIAPPPKATMSSRGSVRASFDSTRRPGAP